MAANHPIAALHTLVSCFQIWRCPNNYSMTLTLDDCLLLQVKAPLIDIMSLITDDWKHPYCWQMHQKYGFCCLILVLELVQILQSPQALVSNLWSTSEHQSVKQAHLVPDSMTTLACFIPLGARSLMTSRMIKDPMKA